MKQREAELLSVPYFHVVFTLPHELNPLAKKHPKEFYTALFQASWQTIQQFSSDPKHLGAKTGMTSVLHTWGQQLALHPHLHCIIPYGGIDKKGKWKFPKKHQLNSSRKSKYLFPKRALSKVYKAKFMTCLRQQIVIPQSIAKSIIVKDWVVYAKQPFQGPKQVIEYLGRYTHKIAISNHRIVEIDNNKVKFKYKDYRASGTSKVMSLQATEFIRRFALHILPHGFIRMRHYGILASKNKAIDLNKAKEFFGLERWQKQKIKWEDIALEKLKIEPNKCVKCKQDSMKTIHVICPDRGPPLKRLTPNLDF